MALAVPASGSSTPTLVLTASAAGIYLFATDVQYGSVVVVKDEGAGPVAIPSMSGGGVESAFITHLNPGDEIFHYGAACNISGVRLGDEL